MRPLLCEVIAAPTMAALRAGRDAASRADLIELRLDTVDRPDVAAALAGRRRPVIVTCRAAFEGGHFTGSEEERLRLLREALAAGADYVDIEWAAWLARPALAAAISDADRARVILSMHDFERMPADLTDRVRAMRAASPGVVKVAGRAAALRDLLPLLAIGREAARSETGPRMVSIGMGISGLPSRILAAHFHSCWTYAGPAVAPGQITTDRLIDEFQFPHITPHTAVYAVVGRPIAHSISPAMHNAAFRAEGLDAVYVPCEARDFDDFAALAEGLPIAGASVTAPFKLEAYERSVAMDDDVRRVGAANTLRRDEAGGWESRNTDVAGFMAPLESRMALRDARAAILGTGGAARAVAAGLGAAGARVTVYARNLEAGADVAALADGEVRPWGTGRRVTHEWDLLINTTPIGTHPAIDETPFDGTFAREASEAASDRTASHGGDSAAAARIVYDLVYNPRPTRLLREAAAAGCLTLDGLDMLVEQAIRQFAWWTGRTPARAVMEQAATRRLAAMAEERGAETDRMPVSSR